MPLSAKVANVLRRIIQAWGPAPAKRVIWDSEFRRGDWHCLESTPGDCVYACLEKYGGRGRILDMGCGSGNTATEMNAECYEEYTGVDISQIAIQMATERTERCGRSAKSSFISSDFSRFRPDGRYNVILFRDSLYYVPRRKIRALLGKYSAYLAPNGVFIVRLWGGGARKERILRIVERHFPVLERQDHDDPPAVVIVFKGI